VSIPGARGGAAEALGREGQDDALLRRRLAGEAPPPQPATESARVTNAKSSRAIRRYEWRPRHQPQAMFHNIFTAV